MSCDTPNAATTLDPHVAEVIARAEVSRTMLERLAVIGMEMAEEIRERHVQAPLHPEPRHDPNKGFALVSRAVRLTLAFAARIDVDILAMRKGETPAPKRPRSPDKPAVAYPSTVALGPEGIRVRDAVWSAIDAEFGEWDGAMGTLDEAHERLIEYEQQERFVDRPWRECVDAICADLDLAPDWNTWSDEKGFAAPVGKPNVKWDMLWTYDPKRSEERRRRRADAASAHPPDPHARQ